MIDKSKQYRFEKKYIINRDVAAVLKQRISYVLQPDIFGDNGKYSVTSLYFDNVYNSSYNENQSGVLRRGKFRVRYYNGSMDKIRLEHKQKHDKANWKDTAYITYDQYLMMKCGDYSFMREQSEPVFNAFYVANATRHMRGVIVIEYERQVYLHPTANVRITFDESLYAKTPSTNKSFPILQHNEIVMEVKYDRFLPSFIHDLMTGEAFTQQLSVSKFALGTMALYGKH